jgi:DNA repair ATPase RecN
MSDNQESPYNYGNLNTENKKRNNTPLILLGLLAALLLGGNLWQWSSRSDLSTQLTGKTDELTEVTKMRDEVTNQFNEANIKLEELKASNTSMTSQIEQYQRELNEKKAKINSLLKDSKNLALVRAELASTKADYDSKIADLMAQVASLTAANTDLTGKNTQLTTDLTTEKSQKAAVIAEREQVTSERNDLVVEKTALTKKVDIASAIRVSNVQVTGLAVKGSGKEKTTTTASKTSRLNICFNTMKNDVVASGREQFYVRIINPTGETMTVASQGGGTFKNNREEMVPYSQIKDVDYNNSSTNTCTVYDPGQPLKAGNYEVEIYNKGFSIGKGTFTLK